MEPGQQLFLIFLLRVGVQSFHVHQSLHVLMAPVSLVHPEPLESESLFHVHESLCDAVLVHVLLGCEQSEGESCECTAKSAVGDENDFYNGGEGEIVGVKTYCFYYNMDSDRMCVLDNNGDWRYLDPQGSWAATGVALPAGQMAFELAYGRSFY